MCWTILTLCHCHLAGYVRNWAVASLEWWTGECGVWEMRRGRWQWSHWLMIPLRISEFSSCRRQPSWGSSSTPMWSLSMEYSQKMTLWVHVEKYIVLLKILVHTDFVCGGNDAQRRPSKSLTFHQTNVSVLYAIYNIYRSFHLLHYSISYTCLEVGKVFHLRHQLCCWASVDRLLLEWVIWPQRTLYTGTSQQGIFSFQQKTFAKFVFVSKCPFAY